MTEPLEHGTPEGYDAGCTVDVRCPAFAIHGMSCETARIRYVSGEPRYLRLRALGLTSAQIAHELGFTPASSAQRAIAETRPEYQAAVARRVAETQRRAGAPTTTPTPTTPDPTPKEPAMPSPADVAKTSKPLTVQPVPEIPDTVTEALAEDTTPDVVEEAIAAPAVPKTPRRKPVTRPAAKRPTNSAAAAPAQSAIRAWARENGVDVNAKGSVRSEVVAAYLEAHSGQAPAEVAEPLTPAEFDEAMTKARERAELEQLNRDADGEPGLPVAVGQQLVDEVPEDSYEVLDRLFNAVLDALGIRHDQDPIIQARAIIAERDRAVIENNARELDKISKLADPARPEWADVTIPEDIEKARSIAVRLEQELAHTEEQLASAHNAVDVVLAKWDTDTTELKARIHRMEVDLAAARQTANIWAGLYRSAEEDLMRRSLRDEQQLADQWHDAFFGGDITVAPEPRRARRTFWKRATR